ncbi:ProQ/FINO family protein [Halomonas sp. BM-2019]|uniref:ProQ/FINO family protein n=1 Tax=Halomonas sp. BM-2019 TaxID=2811227 RepID=UPI0031FC89E5
MIEERSRRLLEALEGRTTTLLDLLRWERELRAGLESRLAEAEAGRLALLEERRELVERYHELVEENRELDEQNRELEEHNRHLLERLTSGQGERSFPRPARRSQGLSALIGRHAPPGPGGARFSGRGPAAPSPDKSGSYGAAGASSSSPSPSPDQSGSYGAAGASPSSPSPDQSGSCGAAGASSTSPSPYQSGSYGAAGASPSSPSPDQSGSCGAAGASPSSPSPDQSGSYGAAGATPSAPSPDQSGSYGAAGAAPSPQALLAEWYQRYPGAFFKGHTRPLMIGIHEALAEREPWPEKLVRRALACYVNLPRYLKAVREGAERIDLAGNPAGGVDAQAAEHARKKLDRLQAERRGKVSQAAGRSRRQKKPAGSEGRGRAETGAAQAPPAASTASSPTNDQAPNPASGQAPNPAKAPAPTPASGQAPAARAATGDTVFPVTLEEKLTALMAKHNRR